MLILISPLVSKGLDFLSSASFLTSPSCIELQSDHLSSSVHDFRSTCSSLFMSSPSLQHASLVSAGPVFDATKKLQRIGENAFAAALLIAVLQAAVALYQYRSNPKGELIVPPGLTWGVENPDETTLILPTGTEKRNEELSPGSSQPVAAAMSDRKVAADTNTIKHMWKRPLSKVNKWMILLLPWISRQVSFVMERNAHLFHMGFIMSLASLFGIQRPQFGNAEQEENVSLWTVDLNEKDGSRKTQKVVVLGDSLAVGLGCRETFDTNKNQTLPMMRLEVISRDARMDPSEGEELEDFEEDGPAFPKVFAHTLAERLQSRVFWRSAGVDGGAVEDIGYYCLGVVKEEAEKGHPPDYVVLLCGMNDLKKFIGNPFQSSSALAFQDKVLDLINDVRHYAPGCKIILPALPTQMFRRNSLLNIFPLALFLDTIVGFWDSQKKRVANRAPSHVLYAGVSAADVYEWYKKNEESTDGEGSTLIAVDGIHPNRKCYTYWAETVGNKLADKLLSDAGADKDI